MTFAEHLVAYKGYQDEVYIKFSMHRRTAYEMYLSRPKAKGSVNVSIQRFMPLPIDKNAKGYSLDKIRKVHKIMLDKLAKEKGNGGERITS